MKVNLYLAKTEAHGMSIDLTKDGLLATVELEVVPSGQYVIDGTVYTLVGKPTFHIKKSQSHGASRHAPVFTHNLEEVDLLVQPLLP